MRPLPHLPTATALVFRSRCWYCTTLPRIALRGGRRDDRLRLHWLSTSRSVASSKRPYKFETGSALFAKRQPRPFPPPFLSPPSGSFSDALSTHNRIRDKAAVVDGEYIRGQTNGDDAIYESEFLICANDGVGAWATRPRGHAGLWSRLILHYWARAAEADAKVIRTETEPHEPTPTEYLQTAYERTLEVTAETNWQGTTTASGALLHYASDAEGETTPVVYITNLGDCQVMVLRPSTREVIYKSEEQWHWFDCPRQLGTNSPDTPRDNAVTEKIDIQVGDVVLAMTDGLIDNLWEHEIVDSFVKSIERWEVANTPKVDGERTGGRNGGMRVAAQELVAAAKKIAMDPFAESPFMEHAIEEGLAGAGGKMDDISVVAALCVENKEA